MQIDAKWRICARLAWHGMGIRCFDDGVSTMSKGAALSAPASPGSVKAPLCTNMSDNNQHHYSFYIGNHIHTNALARCSVDLDSVTMLSTMPVFPDSWFSWLAGHMVFVCAHEAARRPRPSYSLERGLLNCTTNQTGWMTQRL